MTGSFERIEVITGVARRRRWSVEEKLRIVAESFVGGASVSVVARRHGLRSNQLETSDNCDLRLGAARRGVVAR